jgi:hypothetical protein
VATERVTTTRNKQGDSVPYSLDGEIEQLASSQSYMRLNSSSGGKGPARSAMSLVLHGTDDVGRVTPVDRRGQLGNRLQRLGSSLLVLGLVVSGGTLVSASVCLLDVQQITITTDDPAGTTNNDIPSSQWVSRQRTD